MSDAESGLALGEVVPLEARPSKGDLLYADPNFGTPHMRAHSTVPIDGKGGEDIAGPYEPIPEWPEELQAGMKFSGVAGVHVESADRVIVVSHFGLAPKAPTDVVWGRNLFSMENGPFSAGFSVHGPEGGTGEHHVVIFNREGKLIESWTHQDHLFGKLNRVFIDPADPERHIWVSDSIVQKIFKFSNDGKELAMEIGEIEAGSTPDNPWKGQDIAWLPNGDFYTAGLSRVDRFTAEGKRIWSINRRGSGPGEFLDLHGLVLDHERKRIYVSDRGNARIQIFDEDWNYLDEWRNILAPYSLRLSKDGFVWVGDGFTQKFLKFTPEGKLLLSWGTFGLAPGCMFGPHWFDVDEEGCLYIAENYGDRVQKYRPRSDVEPDDPRFIRELVRY